MKTKLSKEEIREMYRAGDKELLEKLFGKEAFEIDPIKEIQDFSDVLRLNNKSEEAFMEELSTLPIDERAYRKLKLIVSTYNQGKILDCKNEDQPKHYPWFYVEDLVSILGGYATRSGSAGLVTVDSNYAPSSSYVSRGSRLAFLKRDHAIDAGKKFASIYKYWHVG